MMLEADSVERTFGGSPRATALLHLEAIQLQGHAVAPERYHGYPP